MALSSPHWGRVPVAGRSGTIHSIARSAGGVPKHAIERGYVTALGLVGDAHSDGRHHGGPERALCLYTFEQIVRLQAEGHRVAPGALGENVTLHGIDLALLVPGTRLALGEHVLAEVTGYTTPCTTILHCFADGKITRISHKTHPGESRVYARVLREGEIAAGDVARLLDADE